MSLLQYLSHYAEAEASCKAPQARYDHVLIVPAFDEVPSMLDGYRDASAHAGKVLCIVVVNTRRDADPGAIQRTRYLLSALEAGGQSLSLPSISINSRSTSDLVVIDRCSEGRELPTKQGVGLARKIGCDLALAWQQSGCIRSPWLHCSDADTTLPLDYFAAADALAKDKNTVALSYPFWHQCEPASNNGRALELYELSLRYYQHGLQWAGSHYAFHCIGSTMAVRASAYLSVRGMPKRLAGEDFYLLNKVAKMGSVAVPDCQPIQIAQRESARTPYGTGPATTTIAKKLLSGDEFTVYHPRSFALLREWLDTMDEFATKGDLAVLSQFSHSILKEALPLETESRLRDARKQCKTPEARRLRLRTWFDGFKTLKLIHALRDRGLSDLPWHEAFDSAPFVPSPTDKLSLREVMAGHSAP